MGYQRRVHGESFQVSRDSRRMINCSFKLVSLLACLAAAVNASYVTHDTPRCRTEYDTVTSYEQQCSTNYEQECSTVYERECSTNHERQCSSRTEQQCSTVYEQE